MATQILRPNSDGGKVEWTEDPVGPAYSTLDDSVTSSDTPTTGSDRITVAATGKQNIVDHATFTLGGRTVRRVTLYVYGKAVNGSNYYTISFSAGASALATADYTTGSFGWASTTYRGSLTQTQVDALASSCISTGTGALEIDALYLEVETKPCSPKRIGGRRRFIRHG